MIRLPLLMYVLWHEAHKGGINYAKEIYKFFSQNLEEPNIRGIDIPVLFPSGRDKGNHKLDIKYEIAEKVAVVVLVEDNMVADRKWSDYFYDLLKKGRENVQIFPIAFNKNSFNMESLSQMNYINLFDKVAQQTKKRYLLSRLAYELCDLISNIGQEPKVKGMVSREPIQLFIRHHEQEEFKILHKLYDLKGVDSPWREFFEVVELSDGADVQQEQDTKSYTSAVHIVEDTKNIKISSWFNTENVRSIPLSDIKHEDGTLILLNAFLNALDEQYMKLYNQYAANYVGANSSFDSSAFEYLKSKCIHGRNLLESKNIQIAISESDNPNMIGLNRVHLQDFTIEFSRFMFLLGVRICYKGIYWYQPDNIFLDSMKYMAKAYHQEYQDDGRKIVNYVIGRVPNWIKSENKQEIEFKLVSYETQNENSSEEESILEAERITYLNKLMVNETDALVAIGGNTNGTVGSNLEILEEVTLALEAGKPLYLIGAFGGGVKEIIESLKREDEASVIRSIEKYDVQNLNNGLTLEENERLFYGVNIMEMILLIIEGLIRVEEKVNKIL